MFKSFLGIGGVFHLVFEKQVDQEIGDGSFYPSVSLDKEDASDEDIEGNYYAIGKGFTAYYLGQSGCYHHGDEHDC